MLVFVFAFPRAPFWVTCFEPHLAEAFLVVFPFRFIPETLNSRLGDFGSW